MTDVMHRTLWEAMVRCPVLMIARRESADLAEPMAAQFLPGLCDRFWIYTNRGNRIAAGGPASAQFVSPGHNLLASLGGTLTEDRDPAVVDQTWNRAVAAWYPGGREDPDRLLLRFDVQHAEIWTQDASIGGLFRLMSGQRASASSLGRHRKIRLARPTRADTPPLEKRNPTA